MSSIGAYTFMQMTGEKLQPASPVVELIVRPGTDGELYREDPAKARVFEVNTVEGYTVKANANSAASGYVALKLTAVTVIDDLGWTVAGVLVVDVQSIFVQEVLVPSVTGVNYLVRARWLLKPTV
jgi:hypothetical protein